MEEKKITPLSDEYVARKVVSTEQLLINIQGYPSIKDLRRRAIRRRAEEARAAD